MGFFSLSFTSPPKKIQVKNERNANVLKSRDYFDLLMVERRDQRSEQKKNDNSMTAIVKKKMKDKLIRMKKEDINP